MVVERSCAGGRERRGNHHEGEHHDHVLAVAGGLDRVVTQRASKTWRGFARTSTARRAHAPSLTASGPLTVIPSRRLRGIIRPTAR